MASPGSPEQVPWPLEVPWHCHLEHNQQNESHITDDWPYPPCNSVWVTIATVQFTQLCKEGGWLHLPLSHKESLPRYRWHQEESSSMVSCKVYSLRTVCKVGYLTTQGERASRQVTHCFPGHSFWLCLQICGLLSSQLCCRDGQRLWEPGASSVATSVHSFWAKDLIQVSKPAATQHLICGVGSWLLWGSLGIQNVLGTLLSIRAVP